MPKKNARIFVSPFECRLVSRLFDLFFCVSLENTMISTKNANERKNYGQIRVFFLPKAHRVREKKVQLPILLLTLYTFDDLPQCAVDKK